MVRRTAPHAIRSRVGRRIVLLFVLCALVPMAVLGAISLVRVRAYLREQSERGLRQEAKAAGMRAIERLQLLEMRLQLLARAEAASSTFARRSDVQTEPARFEAVAIGSPENLQVVEGSRLVARALDPREHAVLAEGRTLLVTGLPGDRLQLWLRLGSGTGSQVAVGQFPGALLWGPDRDTTLPPDTELVMLDASGRALTSTFAGPVQLPGDIVESMRGGSGAFPWDHAGRRYAAVFWTLPLSATYGIPHVTIVLCEPEEIVLAPLTSFSRTLTTALVAAFFVALLLSLTQIRRNLDPLARLREGTRRLAARDFSTPVDVRSGDEFEDLAESFNAMARDLRRQFIELEELQDGALNALARTVDAKSPWTAGHSERVTAVALALGREMGFGPEALDRLHRGGLLHDIGKLAVPNAILDKPGGLTPEEFAIIKSHPGHGVRILEPIPQYASILPIVGQHHERFDGKGYPAGLAGEAIALDARVLAVADVFDALRSARPYRAGMPFELVVAIIRDGAGSHFDPVVVDAFLRLVSADDESLHLADPNGPMVLTNEDVLAPLLRTA